MITNIHLHKTHLDNLRGLDSASLNQKICREFPYPLSVSYTNFDKALKNQDVAMAMIAFTNDITSNVLHFLSLILASEYISRKDHLSYRVFHAIENMTYRPGPGKWLAFLREIYKHYEKHPEIITNYPEILDFIENHEINKNKSLISIEENHGESAEKKDGFLEFLVHFRNNFAHTKSYEKSLQDSLITPIRQIVDYLYGQLSFLSDYKLYFPADPKVIFKGNQLPDMQLIPSEKGLWLQRNHYTQELFPLIIKDQLRKSSSPDLFLFESLVNNRVFYSSHRHISEKRKGDDEIAEKVHQTLKSIEVEPEILDASTITWKQFRDRCRTYSEHILSEYEINGKYNEKIYVLPDSFNQKLSQFYTSGKHIVFLAEDQGAGKSAFCAHIANQAFIQDDPKSNTLLLDSRLFDVHGKIPGLFDEHIRSILGIKGDIRLMFKRLAKKNRSGHIRIIIDNINEYFTKEADQSYLLDQLMELSFGLKEAESVKFIAIARPEYFKKSFSIYQQSFIDKIQERTFMPEDKVVVMLPGLTDSELEQIWKNYSDTLTGYSPRTTWNFLSPSIKEQCRKPLIMLFLLKNFDNKIIPQNLSLDQIKNQYIKSILKEDALKDVLFLLIKKMHKENSAYLLTENFNDEEIQKISDSSNNPKTGLPRNYGYEKLINIQLLREEKVDQNGLIGKKISTNQEMSLDIITNYFRKVGYTIRIRNALFLSGTILVLFIFFSSILYNKSSDSSQDIAVAMGDYANTYLLNDLIINYEIDEIVASDFAGLYSNNYYFKNIYHQIYSFFIIPIIYLWVFFNVFVFLTDYILHRKKNNIDKEFNFFELSYFKKISHDMDKLFSKAVLFYFLTFACVLIITHFVWPVISDSNPSFLFYTYGIILLCSALFYLGRLFYTNLITERRFERYFILSNLRSLKIGSLLLIIGVYSMLGVLYLSQQGVDLTTKLINSLYVNQFINDVHSVLPVDEPTNVENISKALILSTCLESDSFICLISRDIDSIIKNGTLPMFSYPPEMQAIAPHLSNDTLFDLIDDWLFYVVLLSPLIIVPILWIPFLVPVYLARKRYPVRVELQIL